MWYSRTEGGREGGQAEHTHTHGLTVPGDDDGDDQAVNTQDTRHDDGDDVAHDQAGVHDTHGTDAHPGLGRPVGGAQVCWREEEEKKEQKRDKSDGLGIFQTHSILSQGLSVSFIHVA